MNDYSDDLDLAACLRRARLCTLGLIAVLAINFSLVALALGGFGSAPQSKRPAAAVTASPRPAPQATAPVASEPVELPAEVEPPAPALAPPAPPVVAVTAPVIDPAPPVLPTEPPPAEPAPPVVASADADPVPAPAAQPPAVNPPPAVSPPVALESLIVVNPPLTGGAVHFAIDGVVRSLEPGQYVELTGVRLRHVEYHRGEEFGYAAHDWYRGCYAFEVGDRGWTLAPLEGAAERKLLDACVRQK